MKAQPAIICMVVLLYLVNSVLLDLLGVQIVSSGKVASLLRSKWVGFCFELEELIGVVIKKNWEF